MGIIHTLNNYVLDGYEKAQPHWAAHLFITDRLYKQRPTELLYSAVNIGMRGLLFSFKTTEASDRSKSNNVP